MKHGLSLFSFTKEVDYKKIFKLAKIIGYNGVEPILSDNGYLNLQTSDKEVYEMKKLADDNNIEIPSLGTWLLWENNLVSNDKKIRENAKNIIKRQIDIANILCADTILVVPGYVSCDFVRNPERIRYDIAYERAQEELSKLAEYAKSANITIGIENVWNKFLLSPIEIKRFIDEIDSEYVGVYFDVGNIIYIGYPEQWIEILGKHIKKIHLSDYRFSQTGLGAFVDLFAGDVDYKRVVRALKKIEYDDYITLEMLPNYKQFPELSIKSNKYAMDKISELYSRVT